MQTKMADATCAVAAIVNVLCSENNKFVLENLILNNRNKDNDEALLLALHEEVKNGKKGGFVADVIPRYTDFTFKTHFRLSRSTVESLIGLLPQVFGHSLGRPALLETSPESVVLLSLWTLGNQESFRGIADRFGMGQGHAYREFVNFCRHLCSLRPQIISWPRGRAALQVMQEFSALHDLSFPNVIGCVDETHISTCMPIPNKHKTTYYSKKPVTSVHVQGVCDSKLRFLDVFVGSPGSSHDGKLWNTSTLCQEIEENPGLIPKGAYILGGSSYPLSMHLMITYKDGHLTEKEKLFNEVHSCTWVVIEQAFGHLFARFRRLKHLARFRMDRISLVIVSGCILHNLCIDEADELPELGSDDDNDINDIEFVNGHNDEALPIAAIDAVLKRETIADNLFANCL